MSIKHIIVLLDTLHGKRAIAVSYTHLDVYKRQPYTYIENRRVLAVPDHVTGVFPLDRTGATQQELWQRGPAAPGYDFEKVIGDMNDKVLELIDEHSDEPFFLYYPTHAVHGPLLPPEGFKGRSGLNVYGDIVLYLDYLVGTVQDKLKEKGIFCLLYTSRCV